MSGEGDARPGEGRREEPAEVLERVRREIDAVLAGGEVPEPAHWVKRYPWAAEAIEALVEMRVLSHGSGDGGAEPAPGREHVLARAREEIQDAVNRGEQPELQVLAVRFPELAGELDRIREGASWIAEALEGDHLPADPETHEDFRESLLGRYRLERPLGLLPPGPLYRARGDGGRVVDLLLFRPLVPQQEVWRVLRRVERSRVLTGPGVVPVVDAGESRGVPFVAWEPVRGETLGSVMGRLAAGGKGLQELVPAPGNGAGDRGRDLPAGPGEPSPVLIGSRSHRRCALELMAAVCRVLARAHTAGVLHRTLAPWAVVVDPTGRVHLRGFGLFMRGEASPWLSPEQLLQDGRSVDWRTDVYGAAAVLHGLLALAPPLPGDDPPGRLRAGEEPGSRLTGPLPARLRRLLRSCLARDPGQRPDTCEDLAGLLDRLRPRLLARGLRRGLSGLLRPRLRRAGPGAAPPRPGGR